MRVSTAVTVSVLLPAEDRVRTSLPVPRLTVPLAIAVASITVSAPVLPVTVSMFETVTLLVPAARVSVSAPAPRSMAPPTWAAPRVILSMLRAAGQGLDVGDRQRVGAGRGEGERVGAGAEIDGAGRDRRADASRNRPGCRR